MSKIFSKKDINNIILKETKGYYILNKSDLTLNEDAYVDTTSNNLSKLGSAMNDTFTKDKPLDNTVTINATSFAKGSTIPKPQTTGLTTTITGSSQSELSKNVTNALSNTSTNQGIMNNGGIIKAKVTDGNISKEHLNKLREGSVPFTKKEIKEMFKK
jgi:hypothetical protein